VCSKTAAGAATSTIASLSGDGFRRLPWSLPDSNEEKKGVRRDGLDARGRCRARDIEQARAQLIERDVEVSEITSFGDGGAYDRFFFLKDPDGKNRAVQEVPAVRPALQAQAEDREA
jgi:hypothetical protein